jgi:tetratricopeptide (TPR) repeat protein|tara:strand:- start:2540 stop:3760 length:1221 start_codon:yes stop_codon:yes gene_type:complete
MKQYFHSKQIFLLIVCVTLTCCKSAQKGSNADAISPTVARFLLKARDALRKHNFEQAFALADSAEKYALQKANVHFFKGRIYSELGRFDKAEEAYLKALSDKSGYKGVWNNLGNNAFRQQKFEQAIKFYKKEIEDNPASIPLRALGRAYVELGQTDSARVSFLQAIATDSSHASSHHSLAQLEEDEGNFKEAMIHAGRAFGLQPNNWEYRYTYSALLVQVDKGDEAEYNLRKLVEKWPWHHGAYYNLGRALVQMDREDEGKEYLDKAEQVRADQAKIDHLENTVRALPDDPYSYAALAFALRRAGRYNDAMHSYKVALYLDPENLDIRNNVANLYLLQGDTATSLETYRQILAKDSTLVDIWMNLGVVYALSNKQDEARSAWEQALNYQPENLEAKAYLKKVTKEN